MLRPILLVLSFVSPAFAQTGGESFRDCDSCPEMVAIPPGSFLMGSDHVEAAREGDPGNRMMVDRYEGPIREVVIERPFALATKEVTVAEFAAFVADTGHQTGPSCRYAGPASRTVDPVEGFTWREAAPGRPAMPQQAVGCIAWHDATAYTEWLSQKTGKSYRLPSEAEWEYAARAGRPETAYAWGDDPDEACQHGNIRDRYGSGGFPERLESGADCFDGWAEASPVGLFQPNPFGVYDMTGGVWEWVQDCYRQPYGDTHPRDGSALEVEGACDRRGTRGGSWITSIDRQRPTFRGRDPEDLTSWIFGLRVARDLP